jgi:UDP-N-acetylmuramate: L-alanyl-gamma-D-glutamyl-meso-diaminopimelate ligase
MLRSRSTHSPPDSTRLDIYLIAIGGTGMAPLACLLREAGHAVRGSDGPLYPPMSDLLAAAGIEPLVGFDPAHLEPHPELVVVGNAVPRSNDEAVAVEALGLPRISMPEALARFFFDDRRPLVVAGTHGKTTTTSLAAWVYSDCGRDPGFLVGGIPRNLGRSFRRGEGDRFIVEGDEYNAAYFDRGPKFLHYRAHTLILTSVEHDHADLYPEPEDLLAAYRKLVSSLPADGLLVAYGDDSQVRGVAADAPCEVLYYGLGEMNDVHPEGDLERGPDGTHFALRTESGLARVHVPLAGDHNVANALAVWTAAIHDDIAADRVAAAIAGFEGAKRRMEVVGTAGGVTVIDDFAHHPTAVDKTLAGLRDRYPSRRVVALFEPRTLTAGRRFLQEAYLTAFARADQVILAPVFHAKRLAPGEQLDLEALAGELARRGTPARVAASAEAVLGEALEVVEPGDVAITMSSGEFGRLPYRLLEALENARGA